MCTRIGVEQEVFTLGHRSRHHNKHRLPGGRHDHSGHRHCVTFDCTTQCGHAPHDHAGGGRCSYRGSRNTITSCRRGCSLRQHSTPETFASAAAVRASTETTAPPGTGQSYVTAPRSDSPTRDQRGGCSRRGSADCLGNCRHCPHRQA